MKTLYLIRGIPGSGKTTMAKKMGLEHHYEADMWFERNGIQFCAKLLPIAHEWCRNRAGRAMLTGKDIVVSNTFVKKREMRSYYDLAVAFGYSVNVTIANGNFRSIHSVPEYVIKRMVESFEF